MLADAARALAALALAALSGALWLLVFTTRDPGGSAIRIVDPPGPPSASPSSLAAAETSRGLVRLVFAGDVMQHHAQMRDDFAASYRLIAPAVGAADLAVANLEFPVDTSRPVGPPSGGTVFNGSPAHLAALASAGFDLLGVANNHAYDQGAHGLAATVGEITGHRMRPLGRASPAGERQEAVVVDVRGVRVGFLGYTFVPNRFPGPADSLVWPPRDLELTTFYFRDWQAEFRSSAQAVLRAQAAEARRNGAAFLVAFVHWGEEWHLQPTPDQRLAAHDMVDAGFDLVVGSHPHTLQPAELYRGRLIAYSLGNLISDFEPLAARTGALLEVSLAPGAGHPALAGFRFIPVTVRRRGHIVVAADSATEPGAWALACRVLGTGVARCGGGSAAGGGAPGTYIPTPTRPTTGSQ